jgi:hypothetical protein
MSETSIEDVADQVSHDALDSIPRNTDCKFAPPSRSAVADQHSVI